MCTAAPLLALVAALGAQSDRTASVFERLDLPEITDSRFVILNIGECPAFSQPEGRERRFRFVRGWLLSATDSEATIFGMNLVRGTFPIEGAPASVQGVPRRIGLDYDVAPKRAAIVAFAAYCGAFLGEQPRETTWDFDENARGRLPYAVEAALLAHWCDQLGMRELAASLEQRAVAAAEASWDYRRRKRDDPAYYVASRVAANLRWQAIRSACAGEPRLDLLRRWNDIARGLPENEYTDEAIGMVSLYRGLLREDRERQRVHAVPPAGMSEDEQIDALLYGLRDLAARQTSQPGSCRILSFWKVDGKVEVVHSGASLVTHVRSKTNPAEELYKIGQAAVPRLVARLGDPRPTRYIEYRRDFDIESFRLLRYGDCCHQILEAIAGRHIFDWSSSGQISRRVTRSDPWACRTVMPADPNDSAAWLAARVAWLEGEDRLRRIAAAQDLAASARSGCLDALARYLSTADSKTRGGLLAAVAFLLTDTHEDFLMGMLAIDDPWTICFAAMALWRICGSDAGVARLAQVLEATRDGPSRTVLREYLKDLRAEAGAGVRE